MVARSQVVLRQETVQLCSEGPEPFLSSPAMIGSFSHRTNIVYIGVACDSFSLQLTCDIEHFKLCFISFLSMCMCAHLHVM